MSRRIFYPPVSDMSPSQIMATEAYKEGLEDKMEGKEKNARFEMFSAGWCLYMAGYHDTKEV